MKVVVIPDEGLDEETRRHYRERFESGEGCRWCGGIHARECPRIKHIIYNPSDERSVREVEFWADGDWDSSAILFPEDVIPDGTPA